MPLPYNGVGFRCTAKQQFILPTSPQKIRHRKAVPEHLSHYIASARTMVRVSEVTE